MAQMVQVNCGGRGSIFFNHGSAVGILVGSDQGE